MINVPRVFDLSKLRLVLLYILLKGFEDGLGMPGVSDYPGNYLRAIANLKEEI